jgi:hypothetical protein
MSGVDVFCDFIYLQLLVKPALTCVYLLIGVVVFLKST